MDDLLIKRLLKIIEDQLGWGNSETWVSRDFEELNILIQNKTKVSLSSSTLRRLWGKADYKNQPSLTTLDTLARFAGFENWKIYYRIDEPQVLPETKSNPSIKLKKQWLNGALILIAAMLIWGSFIMLKRNAYTIGGYAFNSHPVTHDLPNTVVFTYNVPKELTDSVYIQQSWDETKKVLVDKNKHLFNSIYYKPGFYHAKLTVGGKVVKEHPILIPTVGWLGLIDYNPAPVYLDSKEFITAHGIQLSLDAISIHHLSLEPAPPLVEFYNTGNFKPVSIKDFSFKTEVKNDYKTGASRCQQINILLYTTDIPISIPIAQPGCIATLTLLDGHSAIKGVDNDLSGFGVNPSSWVKVEMASNGDTIMIKVNGKKVFEISISDRSSEILGLGFIFNGSASIRKIELTAKNHIVFKDFN